MAKLRNLGNALAGTGDMLLQHVLRLKQAQEQSGLVAQRQQELAEQQNAFRKAQAEDAQAAAEQQSVLNDPTGAKAEMLVRAGKNQYAGYVPTEDVATARYGSGIGKFTKREELPSDMDLERGLSADPGGMKAAKNPLNIESLMQQRNLRRGVLDEAAQADIADTGQKAYVQSMEQGKGAEAAQAAAFPAKLAREKQAFSEMTPLEVRRSSATEGARQAQVTAGEAARTKQMWNLAAQDPVIAGIAEQVISGTPLKEVPAAQRGYVMAALRSDRYAPQARQKAKEVLDIGYNSLQRMKGNPEGMEGFTGNAMFDLLQRNPITGSGWGGSPTGDFQSNFEQFVSATALDKIDFLKGFGHLSDADMAIIKAAGTNLASRMGTPTFASGLSEVEREMIKTYQKLGIEPPASSVPTGTPLDSGRAIMRSLIPTRR
jgi:hypothetical protein